MRIFGVLPDNCEWLIERKYGAYVATKCRSGFQVYGKSMREIIDALRAEGITTVNSKITLVNKG